VVFSTLTRRGMPLIRYRMGDRSRFIPGDCLCGTKLKTLEKVRGRFGGMMLIGDTILSLPDFDEALFPIPDLLNYQLTVIGDGAKPSLHIETQMLTDTDARRMIEQALDTVESVKGLDVDIHCQHNQNEAGSLLKRVILDRRKSSPMISRVLPE